MKRCTLLGLGLLLLACANGCCNWPCVGYRGGCGPAGCGVPALGAPVMQGAFQISPTVTAAAPGCCGY